MAYVLIENGVVTQKQPYPHDGFIEAPDNVVCGMLYDAGTGEFSAPLPEPATPEQLLANLETARKAAEIEGVMVNGIRYSGAPDNRQALNEALQFAQASSTTTFPGWKDSDGGFHVDHPVADVQTAYEQIGARRGALIELEGQYAGQVMDGTLTDVSGLSWETSSATT